MPSRPEAGAMWRRRPGGYPAAARRRIGNVSALTRDLLTVSAVYEAVEVIGQK